MDRQGHISVSELLNRRRIRFECDEILPVIGLASLVLHYVEALKRMMFKYSANFIGDN